MDHRRAKRLVAKARPKLELYYDRPWQCWGLIDPSCVNQDESIWLSPADLDELTEEQLNIHIATMHERIEKGRRS